TSPLSSRTRRYSDLQHQGHTPIKQQPDTIRITELHRLLDHIQYTLPYLPYCIAHVHRLYTIFIHTTPLRVVQIELTVERLLKRRSEEHTSELQSREN